MYTKDFIRWLVEAEEDDFGIDFTDPAQIKGFVHSSVNVADLALSHGFKRVKALSTDYEALTLVVPINRTPLKVSPTKSAGALKASVRNDVRRYNGPDYYDFSLSVRFGNPIDGGGFSTFTHFCVKRRYTADAKEMALAWLEKDIIYVTQQLPKLKMPSLENARNRLKVRGFKSYRPEFKQ